MWLSSRPILLLSFFPFPHTLLFCCCFVFFFFFLLLPKIKKKTHTGGVWYVLDIVFIIFMMVNDSNDVPMFDDT